MRPRASWAALFVGPALLLLGFYLIYPAINTIWLSFFDASSQHFVGLANFRELFHSPTMLMAFRNNLIWLIVFTTATVLLGLAFAVLTDRVRYESLAKAVIFLPMAISFTGAGVIWKFMYAYVPPGGQQVGLLNQIMVSLGLQPVGWLITQPWVDNLALIAVGVWIWTGFSMVILSAAYKGIPRELLEAARVDGASEWQVFRFVSLPALQTTLAVVATTMIINVLKIFDIVYVMTNGNFGTEVLANRMYTIMFQFQDFGQASAIAVILLILVLPFMLINVRRFRAEEGQR